jgi:fumarylacetoacetate (FAA) hydrolase
VITGDVKMGATPEQALDGIRLVMLANDVSLRNLIPAELAKGFGFFQSKPATAFSPVAVTLDELGDAWDAGRLHLTLQHLERPQGRHVRRRARDDLPLRPADCPHLPRRATCAPAASWAAAPSATRAWSERPTEWPKGYSCIAEKRCIETIQDGKPTTEFMKYGDTIRIEVKGKDGASIFGAIDQSDEIAGD